MALDTNLMALATRGPQVEDYASYAAKMNAAQQQQQMGAEQVKAAQLENQGRERELRDSQILQHAYSAVSGDMTQLPAVAAKLGASPKALMALQSAGVERDLKKAETAKNQSQADMDAASAAEKRNSMIAQSTGYLMGLDPEQRAATWAPTRQFMIEQGHIDPAKVPEQYPGDQWIADQHGVASTQAQKDAEAKALREQKLFTSQLAESVAKAHTATIQAGQLDKYGMSLSEKTGHDQAAINAAETRRHNSVEEGQGAQRVAIDKGRLGEERRLHDMQYENVKLTPEAIEKAAEMFANTGQLPSLGMGAAAAGNRSAIINMAQKKFPGVEWGTNKAVFQANTDSLKKLQTNMDAMEAFESTAGKNLDVFLSAAQKVPDSGVPLLNTPIRLLSDKMLGSPELVALKASGMTAKTEIAKVLNSANGNGVLSDSARHEVAELIGDNATLKQTIAAANILKQDMRNRKSSYTEQRDAIQARLSSATQPQGNSQPKATHRYNLQTGKIEEIKP